MVFRKGGGVGMQSVSLSWLYADWLHITGWCMWTTWTNAYVKITTKLFVGYDFSQRHWLAVHVVLNQNENWAVTRYTHAKLTDARPYCTIRKGTKEIKSYKCPIPTHSYNESLTSGGKCDGIDVPKTFGKDFQSAIDGAITHARILIGVILSFHTWEPEVGDAYLTIT